MYKKFKKPVSTRLPVFCPSGITSFPVLVCFVLFTSAFIPTYAQVYEYRTTQLSQWNGAGTDYSDIWGYAAGGKEYAILGSATKIHFFNVTNPSSPVLIKSFGPFPSTSWREIKTYSHYAYTVSDGSDPGGLRIFDLQYLPDSVVMVRQTTAFFTLCHMPFIDEANARLYCAGTNTQRNGVIVLNLSVRPDSPTVIINQVLPRNYIHDVYVRNNIMYASHGGNGLSIYNCTGNACGPELMSYIPGGYNHSSWINPAGDWLVNAVETQGVPLRLIPLTSQTTIDPANIKAFKSKTLREQYPAGNPADTFSIGHNPYFVGNLVYASYYTDGVQVFDVSDRNHIKRIAYFDTDRTSTSYSPVFRGCWGVYPFLPSGNILASDIQSGMWIFKVNASALPIKYTQIDGIAEDGTKIKLEINGLVTTDAHQLILEKSTDGVKFIELKNLIQWKPDIKFAEKYTDLYISNKNYYRLKLVHEDGTIEYSDIKFIEIPLTSLKMWPNPIQDRLFFLSPLPLQLLEIIDLQGRILYSNKLPDSGDLIPDFIRSGVYVIRVSDGRSISSQKWLVRR